MSATNESNGKVQTPEEGSSVLSNLPRTRPQRATARRAASRRGGEREVALKTTMAPTSAKQPAGAVKPAKPRPKAHAAKAAPPKPAGATKAAAAPKPSASRKRGAAPRSRPVPAAEPVPRQGFESEGDRASGPVSPPGGIELVASAAELFGELAKAGVSTGERLLRDVFSRLPGT